MFDAFTFTHNRKQTTDLLMPTQRLPSKYVTVDTAHVVCGAGSVYQSGVHLSVPSVYVATSCCGFAAGRPVGRRYQSTAVGGGPPQQQWRHRSMVVSSKCEQCHIYSHLRRLNAGLFITQLESFCCPIEGGRLSQPRHCRQQYG